MTDQLSIMQNFLSVDDDNWLVTGIGNSKLAVKGKGEVEITSLVNGVNLNCNNQFVVIHKRDLAILFFPFSSFLRPIDKETAPSERRQKGLNKLRNSSHRDVR